jgi:hypothetical protein
VATKRRRKLADMLQVTDRKKGCLFCGNEHARFKSEEHITRSPSAIPSRPASSSASW